MLNMKTSGLMLKLVYSIFIFRLILDRDERLCIRFCLACVADELFCRLDISGPSDGFELSSNSIA